MSKAIDQLKERLFRAWLSWQTRPVAVRRYLAKKKIEPGGTLEEIDLERIRVAAVQMRLQPFKRALDYVDLIYQHVARAVAGGAQLIVFPEYNATHLLGCLPGFEEMASGGSLEEALGEMEGDISPADIFRFVGPATKALYEETYAHLARAFDVYIHAGSAVLPVGGGRLYNTAYLFGPDGKVLGRQHKLHLTPDEESWGMCVADGVTVIETPLGNVGIPVCMDITYFETFRILTALGADIVLVPSADNDTFSLWKKMRGIWPRVQESPVYGVHSCMVGSFAGWEFSGFTGIFAPRALTPDDSGVLVRVSQTAGEGMALGDVNISALRRYRGNEGDWRDYLNTDLIGAYLPDLYQRKDLRVAEEATDTDRKVDSSGGS